MAARRFVLPLLLVLVSSVNAFGLEHHHWQKKSVMNNTANHAQPTWGFGVPPETWGWFGVHYWPRQGWHRGYYGGQREWGYRQGY